MILITVGTQLPFDRLVKAIDDLVPSLSDAVTAQIGKGTYEPRNISWIRSIDPSEFDTMFSSARVIVSHAGIGTVLTARRFGKPIVVVPRLASLGEHRNDHQLATASQLEGRDGIYVARSTDELGELLLGELTAPSSVHVPEPAHLQLVSYLKSFIAA